ncbi:ABC transporter ATP-binding protein [Thalassospira mesophila]|uniref:Branched-chain amino acid ABC transporter substrate-binding protein n=1 Tax=Thalassospira mesophila TaxID=1293891 RepID=A0A1Y2KZ72_9PROT|nr:ABC transporter ATP-binding protein [Thalassospira mesophila]OSQ38020.1 branched-chain amino acid ABC transporter substrate-binding protein [Thalassospira mesophila]
MDNVQGRPVFEARNLYKSYGGLRATDDLSIQLETGKIHALIGPNGAGKTTALSQLSGELRPDDGQVWFDGQDITRFSMPWRARMGVARSFQITAIFDDFTVAENVAVAVQSRTRHHFSFWRAVSRDAGINQRAMALLEQVGLGGFASRRAADLSHGQKRQLEIAMALALEPKVLLLDEPMAGMGPTESNQLAELLEKLKPDFAILLVEHDMNIVFRLADVISVLVNGAMIASGSVDDVRDNEDVQKAYLAEGY